MPPYYYERGIGIQQLKDDERLEPQQIDAIAAWVDQGAPEGNPEDTPAPPTFDDSRDWQLGEPDLVVSTGELFVKSDAPDWWGKVEPVPTGLTEDRYVAAVQMREVNDLDSGAESNTSVGGLYAVHHMTWATQVLGEPRTRMGYPTHELGRNTDVFDPRAGRLLQAGSSVIPLVMHLHSNGRDTRARMEIGFYFHPVGYEPEFRGTGREGLVADGMNISMQGNEADQELHAFTVLDQHVKITAFEPHLHGPGARMCLEAIWGTQIETLACAGYDHNWVKQYTFDEDYAPLLPKGTILHITGYMDNSPSNANVPDPRNWQGSGNRSVANMFMDLGNRIGLTDEQFVKEMADRRARLGLTVNDHIIGCPLCGANLPELGAER